MAVRLMEPMAALVAAALFVTAPFGMAADMDARREYARIAGRILSLAGACRLLRADVPASVISDIEDAMGSFGATPQQYAAWRDSIVSAKTPDILVAFRQEHITTIKGVCFNGIEANGAKLSSLLRAARPTASDESKPVDTARTDINP